MKLLFRDHSSNALELFFPCHGSVHPLPWKHSSPVMEAFFPCLGAILPCNIRKSYGFPQASSMAFPKNQSAEGAKRPIALDVFRYLVCRLSPEGCDINLPLRTTMPMDFAVFQKGGIVSSIVLRTFRFAPSLPQRFACGPRQLTAAGGQGPQDNTAYGPCTSDQSPSSAEPCVTVAQPLRRSTYMENRGQTKRPWRALCGISACSPLGKKPQRAAVIPSGAPSA